jgi:2-keto-4-pentenoate hydratase/2-oxohepta-3-ene-1,7-dioic acid hydratase in catechol pathway
MNLTRRTLLTVMGATGGATATGVSAALTDESVRTGRHERRANPDLPRGLTLGTIRVNDQWRLAAKTERGVLDVVGAAQALGIEVPNTIDEMFRGGGGGAVEATVRKASTSDTARNYIRAASELTFGPCLLEPEKILMVGYNYRKHIAEVKAQVPTEPVLFNKFNNALLGHGATVPLPTQVSTEFDYEVELVIVMGKTGRDIAVADALSFVAGYCTGNDFSARDLQRRSTQFMLGKTPDGFAPLGPWLVTADQIPNPNSLSLSCHVNGERRQFSNTSDMLFSCAQIVSYISRHMTLRPGDIVYTGTPEGVIQGYPPERRVWLKPGDQITCEVEKLGELRFALG